MAFTQVRLILCASCILALEATSGEEKCSISVDDEVALVQSRLHLKRSAESAPPPDLCSPCDTCTLSGAHTPGTWKAWEDKCKESLCAWTNHDTFLGTCSEGEKAMVFNFGGTLALHSMQHYIIKDIQEHFNPDEVFDTQEANKFLRNPTARELHNAEGGRLTNYLEEMMKPEDGFGVTRGWTDETVRDEMFGGAERVQALQQAMSIAQNMGWQLWVLSNGVEAEINTALEATALDKYLPPDHVIGIWKERIGLNPEDHPKGLNPDWPQFGRGASGTSVRKADMIRKSIPAALTILFDDDHTTTDYCEETSFCMGVLTKGLVSHLADLIVDFASAPQQHIREDFRKRKAAVAAAATAAAAAAAAAAEAAAVDVEDPAQAALAAKERKAEQRQLRREEQLAAEAEAEQLRIQEEKLAAEKTAKDAEDRAEARRRTDIEQKRKEEKAMEMDTERARRGWSSAAEAAEGAATNGDWQQRRF